MTAGSKPERLSTDSPALTPMGNLLLAAPNAAIMSAAALALLAAVGWWLDIDVLRSTIAGLPPMRPAAILLVLVVGASLWLTGPEPRGWRRLLAAAGAGVVVVATVRFLFAIGGAQFGPTAAGGLVFLALGIAVALLQLPRPPATTVAALSVFATVLPLYRLVEYVIAIAGGAQGLQTSGPFAPMALNGTVALCLLAGPGLFLHPRLPLARRMFADDEGGRFLRLALPWGTVGPVVLAVAIELAVRGQAGGMSFPVVVALALFSALASAALWRGHDRLQAAEVALRDSEARLNTVVQTLPDLVWLKDPQGVYLACNRKFERFVGRPAAEILGHTDHDFFPAEQAETFRGHDRAAIAAGGPRINEEVVRYGDDGHREELETIKTPVFAADGDLVGVLGIARDITERKLAELRTLRDREQQSALRQMLETALRGGTLEETLGRCLDQLLAVPWLAVLPRGGIHVMDPDGTHLRLTVARNLTPEIVGQCGHLPLGRCLCGKAAATGKMIFADHVDGEHEIIYPGLIDHGHYCLPLLNRQRVIGVLVLYLPVDTKRDPVQEEFLTAVADILATFILRQRGEIALQESEALLERAQELAHIGSWQADFAAGTYVGSPETYRIYGLPAGPASWREVFARVHPDDLDRLMAVRLAALAGQPTSIEFRILVDGALKWLDAKGEPVFDRDGRLTGAVGMVQDITAAREAQVALEDHRQQLELLVASRTADLVRAQTIAHIGSWQWNLAEDKLIWSAETYRIFGIPPDQPMTLAKFAACIHPDDGERVMAAWNAALAGAPYDIEHRIVADGQVKWVRERAETLFADGRAVAAHGAVQDISELKAAEAATHEALNQARHLAQAKSEFLANMSHEIRTPLNAVLGLARIGMRENAGRKSGETCGRILEAGQHLLGVINDILDFSKIEAGKLLIEAKPLPLAGITDHVMSYFTDSAATRQLTLDLSLADGLPEWVVGDPLRLTQVLINLMSNAVKFTHHGGVSLSITRTGEMTFFRIADTGIGMGQEQIGRLFSAFEQADGSTTRQYGGTGLGLAISRQLARLMGGDIEVASIPGQGSTFTVRLPLPATSPPEQPAEAAPAIGQRLRGLRVLAAEDVAINRLVLADLLEQEGAQVVFAEDGQQVLDLWTERGAQAFDVVLMDIQMPILDGLEATRRLLGLAPSVPVIGLTAHALAEEREKCLAAGMVEHVTKPIEIDALVAAILRHVAMPQTAANDVPCQPADTAAAADRPEIDWTALSKRFKNREAFIAKLLRMVIQTQGDTPARLRDAASRADMANMAFIGHNVKGMAGTIDAWAIQNLASRLQDSARASATDAVDLAEQLAERLEVLLAMLREKIAGHHAEP